MDSVRAQALAACYTDMRRVARRIMANDKLGRVLQPTEIANEAAIRLLRANLAGVESEGHLLALAARTIRQVLIDEARKAMANKRQAVGLMTLWPDDGQHHLIDLGSGPIKGIPKGKMI